MNAQPIEPFLLASDRDFVSLVLLRRNALQHDPWYQVDIIEGMLAQIVLSSEFMAKNVLFSNVDLFLPDHDYIVTYSKAFVSRLYFLLLGRHQDNERPAWDQGEYISLNAVCADFCSRSEFFLRIRSPVASQWTLQDHARDLNMFASYVTHDCYNLFQFERLCNPSTLMKRLRNICRAKLSVVILIIDEIPADIHYLNAELVSRGYEGVFNVRFTSSEEINASGISPDTDIFLTSNDNLYTTFPALKASLAASPQCISACWLTDNHHQFPLSIEACEAFDYVFPAHYNMHSYLYGGKALVGTAVPCGIFQWTRDQAADFYLRLRTQKRSDKLYGRHTSYLNRVSARTRFIKEVRAAYPDSEVRAFAIGEQQWFAKTALERFQEMASYKVALSVPVNNDVSMRIFDTLLTGQIPLVPFGLPGLEAAIPVALQRILPVISFQPNDIASLSEGYERALAAFDAGGLEAADARHRYALNHHFGYFRLADMLDQIASQLGRQPVDVAPAI